MGLWVPGHIANERQLGIARDFASRYSVAAKPPRDVLAAIRRLDPQLDLKVYMPTGKWHVVRYLRGTTGQFVRVITLEDDEINGKQARPGMWLYDYLCKCDTQKRDILKEVEDSEAEYYRAKEAEFTDVAHEMAKDMRKPLLADLDGIESTKTVWQGGLE